MDFNQELRFWLIDDLFHRRDAHELVVKENFAQAEIIRVPHPLKLKKLIETFPELNSKFNLFISDYNMDWRDVEWIKSRPNESQDIDYVSGYDNFPGTVKVLEECRSKLDGFMLALLSTMVVPNDMAARRGSYRETENEAWTYEEMPLASTDIDKIHRLTKPFTKEKLKQLLSHLTYLQN